MSMNIEGRLRTEWFNSNFQSDFFLFLFKRQMGNCWNFCWNDALFRTISFEVTKRTSKQSVYWMSSEGKILNDDGRMPNCMYWYHFEFCLDFLLSKKGGCFKLDTIIISFTPVFMCIKIFSKPREKFKVSSSQRKLNVPKQLKLLQSFPCKSSLW